jgi:hypothetical protein
MRWCICGELRENNKGQTFCCVESVRSRYFAPELYFTWNEGSDCKHMASSIHPGAGVRERCCWVPGAEQINNDVV